MITFFIPEPTVDDVFTSKDSTSVKIANRTRQVTKLYEEVERI